MNQFNLNDLEDELKGSENYWKSFLTLENFELGVLYLDPGQEDIQQPHQSDEIYFVLEGDGFLTIDGEDFKIKPKHAYYVPKNVEHKFHGNTVPVVAYYALN